MDPEVIEIPPPVFQAPRRRNRKQVIDLEKDEDSSDVILLDEIVKAGRKGKAIKNDSDGSVSYQPKEDSKSSVPGSHSIINLDFYDDKHVNIDDFIDVEDYTFVQAYFDNANIPAGVEAPVPWLADPSLRKEKTANGSNLVHVNPASKSSSSLQKKVDVPSSWLHLQSAHSKNTAASQDVGSSAQNGPFHVKSSNPLWIHEKSKSNGSFMPAWHGSLQAELNSTFANYTTHPSFYDPFDTVHMSPEEPADTPSGQDFSDNKESLDEDDILRKFDLFKKFDAVEDHLDHHYASKASLKQPTNKWAKRIQEEWKILENDLPDTIFVRVYESRMDLLRAVIVGAEGTPYHDGLFFFDVFFPSSYPNVPPNVYYHSGGLRLNPNLYNCGKVCLSLLNTWTGNKNEKWMPNMSTMLQVLVSIQALILNQKPYFNEPGYASWNNTAHGEVESHKYNESTFILSLKTMLYTLRRPPKHFKDFVIGHFYKRAHDILAACKTYMSGAEVGSLVKGGVQNIHKGLDGCTPHFRTSVAGQVDLLVKEFIRIGVKDCEKFLTQPKGGVPGGDKNNPTTVKRRSRS